jgi:hypothetical protein
MFFDYERKHSRETQIECNDSGIIKKINHALANPELFSDILKPNLITECTACKQKGCLTDYFCHTSSIENAKSIFKCDKILSAVNARKETAIILAAEPGNAAKDPPDFFDYIMFSWGNCQAGDRLVMERMLSRPPNELDLSIGFKPGVRFYFTHDTIENHKNFVNDGYHAAKIKDEIALSKHLHCCIIPQSCKEEFENIIPLSVKSIVYYVENNCKDIWDWSEKVYDFVSTV